MNTRHYFYISIFFISVSFLATPLFAEVTEGVAHSPFPRGSLAANSNQLSINQEDGSVNYTYEIGTLQAKGMNIPVALQYNSGSGVNLDGIAKNWSIRGFPTIIEYMPTDSSYNGAATTTDPNTFTLYLGDGSSYAFSPNTKSPSDSSLSFQMQPNNGWSESIKLFYCESCEYQLNGGSISYSFKLVDTETGYTYYLQHDGHGALKYHTTDGAYYTNSYIKPVLMTNASGSFIKFQYLNTDEGSEVLSYHIEMTSDTGANISVRLNTNSTSSRQITIATPSYRYIKVNTGLIIASGQTKGEYPHDSWYRNYPDYVITSIVDNDQITNTTYTSKFAYNPYDKSGNTVNGKTSFSPDGVDDIAYFSMSTFGYNSGNSILWGLSGNDNQAFINDVAKQPAKTSDSTDYPFEPSSSWGNSILSDISFPSGKKAHIRYLSSQIYDDGNDKNATVNGLPKCGDDGVNGEHHCGVYEYHSDYHSAAVFAAPYAIQIDYTYTDENGKTQTLKGEATLPDFNDALGTIPGSKYAAPDKMDMMHNYTAFPYVAGSYYPTQDAQWQMMARYRDGSVNNSDPAPGAPGYGQFSSSEPMTNVYRYNYQGFNAYTADESAQWYAAPHLLVQYNSFLSTGDNVTKLNTYGYFASNVDLVKQVKDYNLPSKVVTQVINANTHLQEDLQRVSSIKTYTLYGDPRVVTLPDGSNVVYFYTYDDDSSTIKFRHQTAQIMLPNTQRSTYTYQTPSAAHQAYAYFYRFTIDPKTNLITERAQGYILCQADQTECFDVSTIPSEAQSVENIDLYKDVFSSTPPDKTGWISKQTLAYDDYGRLESSSYIPSPVSFPDTVASKMTKQYFEDYTSLSGQGIDISTLPTYLTSGNTADNPVWYVLSTTTTQADANGAWIQDTRTHKTLEIISQYTGMTLAAFNGYDETSQSFLNGKAVSYDAFLVRRQVLDLYKDRGINFSYGIGSGKNQIEQTFYYCKGLANASAVPSQDFLDNTGNCFPTKKSLTALDDMQRKISVTSSQSPDGANWNTLDKLEYTYADASGGILENENVFYQGQQISNRVPLYDASHNSMGELVNIDPGEGSSDDFTAKVYKLRFDDSVGNRNITLKLFPCTGNATTGDYCAQFMTIKQKERTNTGSADTGGNTLYDAKGSRTISVSTYRYNDSNGPGYKFSSSNISILLNTSSSISAAGSTQTIINNFIKSLGISNASGTSASNDGLISSSGWSLSKKEDYYYDIYNRATQVVSVSYEPDTSTWKQRVLLNDYDVKNRLSKTTNATIQNSAQSSDGKSVTTPSGYSTQALVNGVIADADVLSIAYFYNDLDQVISSVLYQDTLDTSTTVTPETSTFFRAKNYLYDASGNLRTQTNCGGSNYPDAGCASNPTGYQIVFDANLKDANNKDASYDGLGRLVAWKDASESTHHRSFFKTQQLQSSWVTTSSSNNNLAESAPICYAYNLTYNWKIAKYFAAELTGDDTQPNCLFTDDADIQGVSSSQRSSSLMLASSYDANNNHVLSKTFPDGQTITYAYNTGGTLASKEDIGGFKTTYEYYSPIGLLSSAKISDPKTSAVIASVQYGYDNKNRVISKNYTENKSFSKTISEQDNQVILTRKWNNGTTDLLQTTQSWYYSGKMAEYGRSDNNTSANTIDYTYDAMSRLSADSAADQPDAYNYDASGNLLNLGLSRDGLDQVSTSGYGYDNASNLTTGPKGQYEYNSRNQLVSFTPIGETQKWSYTYDPEGNLRTRSFNGQSLTYYWNGLSLENLSMNNAQGFSGTAHNFLNKTAYFTTDESGNYNSDARYLIKGLNNNILGTFEDATLATYTPYGQVTDTSSSLVSNGSIFEISKTPWGYKAGLSLPEMGTATLFYKRIYDAELRSFTQSDPVQIDFNRSRAFDDDPIRNNDPTGLFSWHEFKHKIGHNIKVGYRRTNYGIEIGLTKMQIDPVVTPIIANFLQGMVDTTEGYSGNQMKEFSLIAHPQFNSKGWYKKLATTDTVPVAKNIYNGYKPLVMINVMAFKTGNWKLAIEAGIIDGFTIATFGEGIEASGEAAELVAAGSDDEVAAEASSENFNEESHEEGNHQMNNDSEGVEHKSFARRFADAAIDDATGQLKFWARGNDDNVRILNNLTFRNKSVNNMTSNDNTPQPQPYRRWNQMGSSDVGIASEK